MKTYHATVPGNNPKPAHACEYERVRAALLKPCMSDAVVIEMRAASDEDVRHYWPDAVFVDLIGD